MNHSRRNLTLASFGAVQLVALCGDRLKQFSLVSMMGLLAPGDSVQLLKLTLFSQVPILLLTPLAGVLIDRWNKPATIIGACVARCVLLLAVPAFYARSGSIDAFFAAALILSVFDLMFAPARSALLPEVVSADRLLATNATFWALGIAGTLLGFVGGGFLFDYFSWETSLLADSLIYAAAAILMLPVLLTHRTPPGMTPGPARTLRGGLSFFATSLRDAGLLLRESRDLRASLLVQCGIFAVGGFMSVIGIAHVQQAAPPGHALFLAQVGASLIGGLLAGSALAGWFRERTLPARTVGVGAMLCGVAVAGIGRTESLVPMCIWSAVLGTALSPAFIVTETLIQHASPRTFTGRVFAAREALIKAAYIAAAVAGTALNQAVSQTSLLVGLGLFLALLGVILERTPWLKLEKP